MIIGNINTTNVNLDASIGQIIELGSDPYRYEALKLKKDSPLELPKDNEYCIYVITDSDITINSSVVKNNEIFSCSQNCLKIVTESDNTILLIASFFSKSDSTKEVKVTSQTEIKKVSKPWGYELWLTGEKPTNFAFKKIFIKAGNKTSLQYHEEKRETNFIFNGTAILHYHPDSCHPLDADLKKIKQETIKELTSLDIFPNIIHRIEAKTDIMLYEVSTTQLDDVIRLSDDSGRQNGKIKSEHDKNV